MRNLYALLAAVAVMGCLACTPVSKSGAGFRLPDGNVEKGRLVFLDYQCTRCHVVAGLDLPNPADQSEIRIVLGGDVRHLPTYGYLATSIINPSHRLARGYPTEMIQVAGQSKMARFNDRMTISQLTDLVAFVQAQYRLEVPSPSYFK
ncbi:MAG: cytochrome C [Acidobacteriota bacterium]